MVMPWAAAACCRGLYCDVSHGEPKCCAGGGVIALDAWLVLKLMPMVGLYSVVVPGDGITEAGDPN